MTVLTTETPHFLPDRLWHTRKLNSATLWGRGIAGGWDFRAVSAVWFTYADCAEAFGWFKSFFWGWVFHSWEKNRGDSIDGNWFSIKSFKSFKSVKSFSCACVDHETAHFECFHIPWLDDATSEIAGCRWSDQALATCLYWARSPMGRQHKWYEVFCHGDVL